MNAGNSVGRRQPVSERAAAAWLLHNDGLSFRQVGELLGFSRERARQLYIAADFRVQWYARILCARLRSAGRL